MATDSKAAAQAHYARGVALRGQRRPAEALAAFDAALALQPRDAATLNSRGNALRDLGRHQEALASLDRAALLQPKAFAVQLNRGLTLRALDRPKDALKAFDAALRLKRDYAEAHHWRSVVLLELDRPEEALAAAEQARRLAPSEPTVASNHRLALLRLGRTQDALAQAEASLAHSPQSADAHAGRALALLALGRFGEGWDAYEHRWESTDFPKLAPAMAARLKRWPEPADVAGKRVLLIEEQGVGDVVMFASMIPDLMANAASVTALVNARLVRLFGHSFAGADFQPTVGFTARPEDFDTVLAIGSLGRLYRRGVADFTGASYLRPTPDAQARWAQRLGPAAGRKRIGLSWRGGVKTTGAAGRSLTLAALAPLLARDDCEFVSLQYGDVADELTRAGGKVRAFAPSEIADFDELAALTTQMDAVVTVQTSLAHLAGALGVPCHVMLRRAPEWRYASSAETMPWYRSVRLWRQDGAGWDRVVAAVAGAL